MADAFELMDEYNARHGVPQRTRVEYASDELLARFDRSKLKVEPMGFDYLYDVNRMIDEAIERVMVDEWGLDVALGRPGKPEEVGEQIGQYKLMEQIGQGGFGYLIVTGMQRNFFTTEMIAGAVLSVALAIVADALLVLLQRRLPPWTRAA